jgi:RNA polymerase sigma factor (sigma-70 family)
MAEIFNLNQLTDQELVEKIKDNNDNLGIVYKRCKTNCINFMRKMTGGSSSNIDFEDIYQEASIALQEKINKGHFVLTASFQTYLNSVCRNQLLKAISKNKPKFEYQDAINDSENLMDYDDAITDILDEVDDSKEPLFIAMEMALESIKAAGGNCYELLKLFWYQRKKMKEIAETMGYTDAANAKHQKSRCQERLKGLTYNELDS